MVKQNTGSEGAKEMLELAALTSFDTYRFAEASAQHALRLVPQLYAGKKRKSGEPYSSHIYGAVEILCNTIPYSPLLERTIVTLCFHDTLDEAAGYNARLFEQMRSRHLGKADKPFATAFDEAILMAAPPQLGGIAKIVATTAQVHTFGTPESKLGHVCERGQNGKDIDYVLRMPEEFRSAAVRHHLGKWQFSVRHTGISREAYRAQQAQFAEAMDSFGNAFGVTQDDIEEDDANYMNYFAQKREELTPISLRYAAHFGRLLPRQELRLYEGSRLERAS